jgi:hypothetical protein
VAAGHRFVRIPIDGNEFDARFDEAVDTIYRSSQRSRSRSRTAPRSRCGR